jgi:hypothetical protein
VDRAQKNRSIGLAGGVLSAAGLCIGILSIGKKTEGRDRAEAGRWHPRPVEPLSEPVCEQAELPQEKPVATPGNEGREPSDSNVVPRTSREIIADLNAQRQPVLAIAQMLGISVGEVHLTLKLQGRTASASAEGQKK